MRVKLHSYSADTADRQKVHVYLGIAGFLFAYLVNLLTAKFSITIPWWVEAPSSLGYYGLFYLVFKSSLWKTAIFRFLFQLKTPNWNGVYQCDMKSSYDNFAASQNIAIHITQDWDTIAIKAVTTHSTSASLSGSFSIQDNLSPDFTYEYENQPNAGAVDSMRPHKGMATISLNDGKLHGEFFTGRGRSTYGSFVER